MTPQQEQKLRLQLGMALTMAGMTARMFTTRDPAAGMTIQLALADITGKHWDENKARYEALKSGNMQSAGPVPEAFDEAKVDAILALLSAGVE